MGSYNSGDHIAEDHIDITTCYMEDWLVGCFGFNGPFRQYFSLHRAVSQREGER